MNLANPILRIAIEAEKQQWSDSEALQRLMTVGGLSGEAINEAIQMAGGREMPVPLVVRMAGILAMLPPTIAEKEVVGGVLLMLGTGLIERPWGEALRAGVELLKRAREFLKPTSPDYGLALMHEANARQSLAELGVDSVGNLNAAIGAYAKARGCFEPNSPDFGRALMNEASARCLLADLGVDSVGNLNEAIAAYAKASDYFETNSRDFGLDLMNEANARQGLADLGVDSVGNLNEAIGAYAKARGCFEPNSPDFGNALMNEATARQGLADLGVDTVGNLNEAIAAYAQARGCLEPNSRDFGRALMNEATARLRLAELGMDTVGNLNEAVGAYAKARGCFETNSPSFGGALMNEASARCRMAELGVDSVRNLNEAIAAYPQARGCFETHSPDFGLALMNEANARQMLASLGVDSLRNLNEAIGAYAKARGRFVPNSPYFGLALMNEANARQSLAKLGVDSVGNLDAAIGASAKARGCFEPNSPDFGLALMNEAISHQSLAELGVDSIRNLNEGVELFEKALQRLQPATLDRGTCVRNCAHALRKLAKLDPDNALKHLQSAHALLIEGLRVIESVRSQMASESDRIAFLDSMAGQFRVMVLLCLDLADAQQNAEQADAFRHEAWHWIHRSKSRALLETLSGIRPRLRREDQPLWDAHEKATKSLNDFEQALRHRKLDPGPTGEGLPEPIRTEYAKAREEAERCRKVLEQQVSSFRQLQSKEVDEPKELMAALRRKTPDQGSGVLLVEYYHVAEQNRILVFLKPVWRDGPPVIVPIEAETESVINTLNAFLQNLRLVGMPRRRRDTQGMDVIPGSRKAPGEKEVIEWKVWEKAKEELERAIEGMSAWVEPWVRVVNAKSWEITQVVLSPHGLLNHVPWHAVRADGRYLVEHWMLTYAPSGAMAVQLKGPDNRPTGAALVMGNPDTGIKAHGLPGSEREAKAVATLWAKQIDPQTRAYVREEAHRKRYLNEGSGKSAVHTACHTVLFDEFEKSGLLLADGILTVSEILQQVDLTGVQLVYMSSCDTSRADVRRSEELMALVRVMMVAGAQRVLGTLWPLHDTAGEVFAKFFYQAWLVEGRSIPEAFQVAMNKTRQADQRREIDPNAVLGPYAWAPFVLMGW